MHKTIIPTAKMTLYQRGRCTIRFHDATLKALKKIIKGTRWKSKSSWIYCVEQDWYLTAFVAPKPTSGGMLNGLSIDFGIKPMIVDLIYWHANNLIENAKLPLSFRSTAAFQARTFSMEKRVLEGQLTDPELAAERLFTDLNSMAINALMDVKNMAFTDLIRTRGTDRQKGALLWVSLIAEGKSNEALAEIEAWYFDDESAPENRDNVSHIGFKVLESFRQTSMSFEIRKDPYWPI